MKIMKFFLLFINLLMTLTVMAQTTTPEMKEFSEANYLQIDELEVPKGIQRVEQQLRENVIDVIIHSKTHMPIFAQKREKGYSQNYKKFYGINIKILPILKDEDFYMLNLFYYNWTTNKFDKKLVKKISKYNVLNELRFATYEILMGKQWVQDNKDKIENRNFERIQAVRQVITEQDLRNKKKKKRDEIKRLEKEKEEEEKSARKLLKRQEREKAKKKEEDKESEETPVVDEPGIKKDESNFNSDQPEIDPIENVEKNNQKKNSSSKNSKKPKSSGVQEVDEAEFSFVPAPPNVDIPEVTLKKSYLYGNVNYFQESTAITGLVPTVSDLKYIGVGGKFILEKQSYFPNGTRFSILAGIPIFKEEYKFPIYRSIESEIFISNPSRNFKLYMGLDYMPIYFVGLPSQGTGLQVFEDDFIWGKIGLEFDGNFFNRNLEIRFSYLKSLISKSNQNNKIIGSKSNVSAYYQIKDNHGAEIAVNSIVASGAFELSSQKAMISYVYKFEN